MKKKTYKRLLKLLDKVYTILRKELPTYKTEPYTHLKTYIYRSMRLVKDNKRWWVK